MFTPSGCTDIEIRKFEYGKSTGKFLNCNFKLKMPFYAIQRTILKKTIILRNKINTEIA